MKAKKANTEPPEPRRIKKKIWAAAMVLAVLSMGLLALFLTATSTDAAAVSLAQPGLLGFDGDSTVHAYQVKASKFSVAGKITNLPIEVTQQSLEPAQCRGAVTLTIPVKGLRSGSSGLDENMRGALDAVKHPSIVYRFDHCRAKRRGDGSYDATLSGSLRVAGKTRQLELTVQAWPGADTVRVKGTKLLRMSDFGITPPAFLFGRVKASDEIKAFFDVRLRRDRER